MQFKHKLIYFALGCAFVVIAQVLLSIVVPKVTAQGKKMNFTEEMRKRGLLTEEYVQPTTSEPAERVDFTEAIRRHRLLDGKKEAVEFDKVKVRSLEVVDDTGKVRAQLGVDTNGGKLSMYDIDGKSSVLISFIEIGKGMRYGSVFVADGHHKSIGAVMTVFPGVSGMVSVTNKSGNGVAMMKALPSGGIIEVSGSDGKTRAIMCVDQYGDGFIDTYKNERKTR